HSRALARRLAGTRVVRAAAASAAGAAVSGVVRSRGSVALRRTHHHLGGVDGLILPLVRRDLERPGYRLDPLQDVRDGRLQPDPPGPCQADGVLQVGLGADVREEITQAALAEQIDVQLHGTAEPGDADDLAPRPDRVQGLQERLVPGQSLLRTAASTLE